MTKVFRTFTSESVTQGHPDKVADIISDAVLDAFMAEDPNAHVACETCVTTDFCMVFGEVTSTADLDIEKIVRDTIIEIGYDNPIIKFDGHTCEFENRLHEQSPDIKMGVDESIDNVLEFLRPDAKAQVSVNYDEDENVISLETVVLSTQHDESITQEELHEAVKKYVFDEVLPQEYITPDTKFYINPTGQFIIGGPHGDAGLTGRKIIVDTYGGYARHGGGAFSGKDCTKVDRSACYMARYIAKNIVASGLAEKCEVQLSYAIGVAEPTSIMVDTFGTGANIADDITFEEIVRENFSLTPVGIINTLDLRRPIYKQTAKYGHFGNPDLPWEQLDKVEDLKKYIK